MKFNMKRALYIIMLAFVAASCNKSEVVATDSNAISFGDVFVDNITRVTDPSHTTGTIDRFYVYGNVTGRVLLDGNKYGTVNLYNGSEVYKESGIWKCNTVQYWVPECDYSFAAISDVEATDPASGSYNVAVKTNNGLPSSIEYNAASQKDLLYVVTDGIETDTAGEPSTGTDANGDILPVGFTFAHLLSKVQFTFTNNFPQNSGVELKVTDIKITNAAKKGIYNVGSTPEWRTETSFTGNDNDVLSFGETDFFAAGGATGISSTQCVLIPCEQEFNITFTIKHNKGGNDTEKEITTGLITLEKGHFYNFTAELNSGNVEGVVPIDFNIIVNSGGWQNTDTGIKY
jgi:hypothetical protein